MKKIGLLFATLLMIMLFAFSASAATTEDGFKYTVSNGEVTITGYEGTSTELVIPDEIDGCPVTSIANYAFFNRSDFTGDLVIPEGVTSIGERAFDSCVGFTGDLIISESVTNIGDGAFQYCSGFKGKLSIPEGTTHLNARVFCGCSGFTGNLVIPESVTSIGASAFAYCVGFTGDLIIPEGVTSIGNYAFSDCSGFTGDLIIPEGVTSIGRSAFLGCGGFTGKLIIPEGVTNIGDYTFWKCDGFTGDLIIPKSVISIGYEAFAYCDGFTGDLIIPEGVTSIGNYAFRKCSGFTGDLIIPEGVVSIGVFPFYDCNFSHIAYKSTETQWNSIIHKQYGVGFSNDKIHFNFNPETDITENITASTCLIEGSKTTVCSCGYKYSTETLPLSDCSFTTYISDNNATCIADGTKTAYCDFNCGNSNTITDKGSVLGHAMGEFIITKDATCTVNGEERADCSRCDYYEKKELIANNHKDDNLDGICDYCNEYIADKDCLCVCHSKIIGAFVYKLFKIIDSIFNVNLLEKVFGISDICACGIRH